jgi:hypothetical protein
MLLYVWIIWRFQIRGEYVLTHVVVDPKRTQEHLILKDASQDILAG